MILWEWIFVKGSTRTHFIWPWLMSAREVRVSCQAARDVRRWTLYTTKIKLFWFLCFQLNPLQKIPVLSINGQAICDSHAIALHLCRINKENDLYPEDNVLRTKIDEMMYYNAGVLFPIDSAIYVRFLLKFPQLLSSSFYTSVLSKRSIPL